MSRQYIRVAELTVGNASTGLKITGLRIAFEITKDLQGYPNLAKIQIYNLSEDSRSQIQDEFENVILSVGYEGNVSTIFTGDIRNVQKIRQGVDIITEIYAGDGNRDFADSYFNKSFVAGTTVESIISEVKKELSTVTSGVVQGLDPTAQKLFGSSFSGSVPEVMDQLGEENNFDWSIQDNKLDVIAKDSVVDEIYVISSRTGMINSPTITEIGADVTTLLNPKVIPGRVIKVESVAPNFNLGNLNFRNVNKTLGEGQYKVIKVIHSGDTHSQLWQSSITGSTSGISTSLGGLL